MLDRLSGEGTSGTQNTAFTAGSLFGQTMDSQMIGVARRQSRRRRECGALGYAAEQPNGAMSAFNA